MTLDHSTSPAQEQVQVDVNTAASSDRSQITAVPIAVQFFEPPPALAPWFEDARWVGWEARLQPDKLTGDTRLNKIPRIATGQRLVGNAATTIPKTWRALETVTATLEALDKGTYGLGLVLTDLAGLALIDLDKCRDPDTGKIDVWAQEIIDRACTYTELTPSGTGLRVIGTVPANFEELHRNVPVGNDFPGAHYELYHKAKRYVTVTGVKADGVPEDLADISVLLRELNIGNSAEKPEISGPIEFADQHTGLTSSGQQALRVLFECLPAGLQDRITRIPAANEDRSATFFGTVASLYQHGWLLDDIIALLELYPFGAQEKYIEGGRLDTEVKRIWDKFWVNAPEKFGAELRGLANGDKAAADAATIEATPFRLRSESKIPRRQWLYGHHYVREYVTATVAPGGLGKSSLVIAEALAMVSGRGFLRTPDQHPLRVWYHNGEDPNDELERRFAAAAKHYELTDDDIGNGERLFVTSGRHTELVIAATTRDGTQIIEPVIEKVIEEIRNRKIDVLVIDPFVSSHRVPENDNNAIDAVVKKWAHIAEVAGCSIELVHHSRKNQGHETTAEDARGASALVAAARSVRVLNRMAKENEQKAGIDRKTDHSTYFQVNSGKENMAPAAKAAWFATKSILLANGDKVHPLVTEFNEQHGADQSDQQRLSSTHAGGDSVAVVVPWEWPANAVLLLPEDVLAVQERLHDGGYARAHVKAYEWIGRDIAEILKLDTDDLADKERIKHWIRNAEREGYLERTTVKGNKREAKPGYKVGKWVGGRNAETKDINITQTALARDHEHHVAP